MSRKSKTERIAADQKLIAGVEKRLADGSHLVAGKTYTRGQMVALLQARVDAADTVSKARAAYEAALEEERKRIADAKELADGLEMMLRGMHGPDITALEDFGFAPRKRRAPTPKTLVVQAAKARATRTARHTMGPRQRLLVKGELPVANPDPVVTTLPTVDATTGPP